jgi:hypothetical protein
LYSGRLFDFLKKMKFVVPKGGLEPPRRFHHQTLNLARLPVPPLRQSDILSAEEKSCQQNAHITEGHIVVYRFRIALGGGYLLSGYGIVEERQREMSAGDGL